MDTATRLARLEEHIGALERHRAHHAGELERLYALRALYRQATAPVATLHPERRAPTRRPPAPRQEAPAAA